MTKKWMMLALMAIGFNTFCFSQTDYKSAIGGRLAPASYYDIVAFSFKTFISEAGALEFNVGGGSKSYHYTNDEYRPFSVSFSAGYQHHFNIPVEGLRWYIGGGLTGFNAFSDESVYEGFGFGFFPTGGIDYKFPNMGLNLSADLRPTIFFTRPDYYDSFNASTFGISARYAFGSR